jgi:hypothetical protein
MIELVALLGVALFQITITVFGYYSAIGHVNRLLDIEEPESPRILQNMHKSLFSDEALTVADIDSIDDWDAFETERDDEIDE